VLEPGRKAYLKLENNTPALVATTHADYDALIKAAAVSDTTGVQELISAGRVFHAPSGCQVLVLDQTPLTTQVRVLDSYAQGKSGWVAN
jgi:hypothetical protein